MSFNGSMMSKHSETSTPKGLSFVKLKAVAIDQKRQDAWEAVFNHFQDISDSKDLSDDLDNSSGQVMKVVEHLIQQRRISRQMFDILLNFLDSLTCTDRRHNLPY
ncbi:hypothetical protein PROFUN_06472 [Planoprotostelium fungivorum]|uniref:Uncharacterized protein n=1 Tax=Planoprotostelium fungivorum TaxID=1890364 RepID=A0A2P6MR19_9EUKA|nr:hypothetical protein PROFUN_06472 [Planoprotostelium fungivorum]